MLHLESGLKLLPEQKLVLAVDTSDIHRANQLAEVAKKAGGLIIKEGLELDSLLRPQECAELASDNGLDWIADLKVRAISKTMNVVVRNYVDLAYPPIGITVCTDSGVEALRSAQQIANEKGIMIFGVAHLSSINEEETRKYSRVSSRNLMRREAHRGIEANIGGFVSSGHEIRNLKNHEETKGLYLMAVGTRSEGVVIEGDDQKRITTPYNAINNGADLLEVGRQVTEADDMGFAYGEIVREIESAVRSLSK